MSQIVGGVIMENLYFCPDCSEELEEMKGCGSLGYFCNKCRRSVSKRRILSKEQMIEKIVRKVVESLEIKKL